MAVIVSMLRGVNVGGHNKIKMEALRQLYNSLGLTEAQSYIQSGNVVFKTNEKDLSRLASRIENAIEEGFGFRPDVILRTHQELNEVILKNPFPLQAATNPNKLLVNFLAGDPAADALEKLLAIRTDPDVMNLHGKELFIYFPNGMGNSKLPSGRINKVVGTPMTGRNWNSVLKLAEMALSLE